MSHSVDPSAPILLFDTGVGGLTVLEELRKVLPQAPVIYAADYAGLPYGTKTEAEVAARVCGLLGRMSERFHPRAICIACNTASTIALGMVRDVLEVPIVGTVPAIKPAAAISKSGVIGVLGTEATIRQPYVDRLEAEFANGKRLIRHAGPELVDMAEAKLRGHWIDLESLRGEVSVLLDAVENDGLDTVVLACTHFPLLEDELLQIFGPDVRLVHGAEGIARQIATVTKGQEFLRKEPDRLVSTSQDALDPSLRKVLTRYGLESVAAF
jgi:glutamate racemase